MSDDQSSTGSGSKGFLERLSRAFQVAPRDREELIALLDDSLRRGLLDPDALAMMEGALAVAEMRVGDVMVPRSQMVVIPINSELAEFLPKILDSGHSRFPVIGEGRDEVEGILLAKDLLRYFAGKEERFDMMSLLRPALVIPEIMRLNLLLREFRTNRNHLAIVVDEYGGVSGLISLEDVLEEIVGEIDDEHDEEEEAAIMPLGADRYQVNALIPIAEFNDRFACDLSDEEYDTLGGLLMAEFGRVPEVGESVMIDDRFQFRVAASDSRRLISLEMNVLGGN